jgi:hypothetical protein
LKDKIPVVPVFLCEIYNQTEGVLKFIDFNFKIEFPDAQHAREPFANDKVAQLRYGTPF